MHSIIAYCAFETTSNFIYPQIKSTTKSIFADSQLPFMFSEKDNFNLRPKAFFEKSKQNTEAIYSFIRKKIRREKTKPMNIFKNYLKSLLVYVLQGVYALKIVTDSETSSNITSVFRGKNMASPCFASIIFPLETILQTPET